MEEKNVTKISLTTFLLILAVIAIVIMGVFIFKLNNDKNAEIQKSAELQNQVNSLNGTVSDLQGKMNTISETINSSNTTENTTNSESSENIDKTNETNQILEEANVTEYVNKTGLVGKTTYEIENAATNHIDGFDVILENSRVYFQLKDKEQIKNYSFKDYTINRVENKKEEITGFNGKVKKVYFYEVGQDVMPDSVAILFLMEDGSIEYISYADALQTNNLSSRGKINGIYNISEIYTASARGWENAEGGPGWQSCVAKDSNNNYYSLETAFKKNNIDLSKVN